jgi:hypothetical protein
MVDNKTIDLDQGLNFEIESLKMLFRKVAFKIAFGTYVVGILLLVFLLVSRVRRQKLSFTAQEPSKFASSTEGLRFFAFRKQFKQSRAQANFRLNLRMHLIQVTQISK